MPDHASYRAEVEKARKAAKRLDDGIAAASAAISETDYLRAGDGLTNSHMIAGASFEQLLFELDDYKSLNSLALLAEQLERTGIAASPSSG